jgi:signal transduction histidine kinase/CheY-like chemotaxis protein
VTGRRFLPLSDSPRVLVADDNALGAALVRDSLVEAGCSVRVEGDGARAFGALSQESFDLLVTDWEMPVVGGLELCLRIRRTTELSNLQIVVLTAHTGPQATVEALEAGADDFVAKPFHPAELVARVAARLRIAHLQMRLKRQNAQEAALRRVALAVAGVPGAGAVFDAVAREAAHYFGTEIGAVYAFENDVAVRKGSWGVGSVREEVPLALRGQGALARVHIAGRAARIDDYERLGDDPTALIARSAGLRAAVAAPVQVGGKLWGSILVATRRDGVLNGDVEQQLADFAVLLGLAIANDEAARQRDELTRHLRQAQRFEAVGQLAAGVAHEINTPIQFIGDSISFLREAYEEYAGLIGHYRAVAGAATAGPVPPQMLAELVEAEESADIEDLEEQVPRAISRSIHGLDRVARIVKAMKDFSHSSDDLHAPSDIGNLIESALSMAANRIKEVGVLTTDIPSLPPVICDAGDISRVILNLALNAADAVADRWDGADGGEVGVSAHLDGDRVMIAVTDNGPGIPPSVRERIFDPFFTTKPIGRGTGQGLALAWITVVEQHGGTLSFTTEPGRGTTFSLGLPVGGADSTPSRSVGS